MVCRHKLIYGCICTEFLVRDEHLMYVTNAGHMPLHNFKPCSTHTTTAWYCLSNLQMGILNICCNPIHVHSEVGLTPRKVLLGLQPFSRTLLRSVLELEKRQLLSQEHAFIASCILVLKCPNKGMENNPTLNVRHDRFLFCRKKMSVSLIR